MYFKINLSSYSPHNQVDFIQAHPNPNPQLWRWDINKGAKSQSALLSVTSLSIGLPLWDSLTFHTHSLSYTVKNKFMNGNIVV